ncbi:MAG TPA: hypothetical protein P5513_06860 [Candidatus Diapherotrites archaeon]|mgnify:CR=1 FL=1|nr:hypothetical protein [Candidatus Diapherotrites archaeon]
MKEILDLAPITKVFKIIDSCTNHEQLKTCEKLANAYTKLAKEKGIINFNDVKKALYIRIREREEELNYIENFV